MAVQTSGKERDIDVRTEMFIALFWRGLIGDMEYVRFDPEDMLRWYFALELRGPIEIRELLTERYSSRPMNVIQGVVSESPHPPAWLVREWLARHEENIRTGRYWWAAAGFLTMCLMVFPTLHSCINLQPMNPLVMNPPQTGPQQAQSVGPSQGYGQSPSIVPPQVQLPVTATGPRSSGIAGGAGGAAPTTGVTGPASSAPP
jgi:hypothetical protein